MSSIIKDGIVIHDTKVIGASIDWFKLQMASRGIQIPPRSAFNIAVNRLDLLKGLIEHDPSGITFSSQNAYDMCSDAYGVDFVTKAVHLGFSSGLTLSYERWNQLVLNEPIITRPGKSAKSRNQVWETIIASIASRFTDEKPVFAEPDIQCKFSGIKIAIAAKAIYSIKGLQRNIIKGLRQANGKGDFILIFADIVSAVNNVEVYWWSRQCNFLSGEEAVNETKTRITKWCDTLPLKDIAAKMKQLARAPVGVAFFVPLLIQIGKAGHPMFYLHMPITWGDNDLDIQFSTRFLRECDFILGFKAGN